MFVQWLHASSYLLQIGMPRHQIGAQMGKCLLFRNLKLKQSIFVFKDFVSQKRMPAVFAQQHLSVYCLNT